MPATTDASDRGRKGRWLWFAGLYAASLLVFTVVVYLLRWIIL